MATGKRKGPPKGRGKGESKSSARRVEAKARQAAAMGYRRRGKTLQWIANKLGYASISGVQDALKAGMADVVREPAEDLYKMQIERLDIGIDGIWDDYVAGDFKAVDAMIKLMQRRARLAGLDAANKGDVSAGQAAGVVLILPANGRPDKGPGDG